MLAGEQLQPAVLDGVRVLVLVDEDVAKRGREAVANLLEELQDVDGVDEQVVEVHRVHAQQLALVDREGIGDVRRERGRLAGHGAVVVGVAQLVLGVGDLVVDRAGREALRVDAELVEAALDQPPRIGLVVDRELARVAEPVRLGAQHPRAGGVEGHDPHRARAAAEQQLDALAHLLRRLVRERDREDLVRARHPRALEKRDPMRQHPRLARSRARQDQQRALAVGDRLALRRVEARQQLLDAALGCGVGHTP